jgi:hypothetical protein
MERDTESLNLEGSLVLVGLTYYDAKGNLLEQRQVHGVVTSISPQGIALKLSDGEDLLLPPQVSTLQSAPPGDYYEHSSGKTVVNPRFITVWEFTKLETEGEVRWSARHQPLSFPPSNENSQ